MQTIYYNFGRKYLCDASGAAVSEMPEITFAEKPVWRIVPVNDSGTVSIPDGIAAYRAAVKFDFNSATAAAARSMDEQITSSAAGIDVQLNANTEIFLSAVDGQETRNAFFELCGLDLNGDRVFYLAFRICARMILDPDLNNHLPEEVLSAYLDRDTTEDLLAGKTDNADFTALAGRVSAAETALAGIAAVQPGSVISFAGDAAQIPAGYLLCNGAAVSRTDYASLFAAIGTIYGSGDGETTFNLPDFRGKFLRGYLSGTSAALGTAQGDAIRNLTGGTANLMSNLTSPYVGNGSGVFRNSSDSRLTLIGTEDSWLYTATLTLDASRQVPTAAENRPANYAVNYIIKY